MTEVTRLVTITQEDIDTGRRRNCSFCPGAKAILRTFPEWGWIGLRDWGIGFHRDSEGLYMWPGELDAHLPSVPNVLLEFYQAFDHGEPVSPVSFPLTVRLPSGV